MQRVFTQDWLNSFTLFHLHINNYSLDLYNRYFQTTIILFTCNVSSYKSDWIVFEIAIACSVLPFIWQSKQSNECTWCRISVPSRNLYKCKQVVYVIVVCVFCYRLSLQRCCCLYFFIPFLYWCCCYIFVYLLLM